MAADSMKALRQARIDAGMCVVCGVNPHGYKKQKCDPCAEKINAANRDRREKNRTALRKLKNPPAEGSHAAQLVAWLNKNDVSIKILAEWLAVDERSVQRWCTGEGVPDPDNNRQLRGITGIEFDEPIPDRDSRDVLMDHVWSARRSRWR